MLDFAGSGGPSVGPTPSYDHELANCMAAPHVINTNISVGSVGSGIDQTEHQHLSRLSPDMVKYLFAIGWKMCLSEFSPCKLLGNPSPANQTDPNGAFGQRLARHLWCPGGSSHSSHPPFQPSASPAPGQPRPPVRALRALRALRPGWSEKPPPGLTGQGSKAWCLTLNRCFKASSTF